MKKKFLALASLLLISGFASFFATSCDKDTNCYVEVTVLDEETKRPVSNVFIKIDIDSSFVNAQGTTNTQGKFFAQFSAPAIFNVVARYETGYDSAYTAEHFLCYRKGTSTIRLKEGDTIKRTVNLEKTIIREFRN